MPPHSAGRSARFDGDVVGNPLSFLITGRVGRRMVKEWWGSRVIHGMEYWKLE